MIKGTLRFEHAGTVAVDSRSNRSAPRKPAHAMRVTPGHTRSDGLKRRARNVFCRMRSAGALHPSRPARRGDQPHG